MLEIAWTRSIKKDIKRFQYDVSVLRELDAVIRKLVNSEPLPARYRDHRLTGNWHDHRECHVKNDVLLIYQIDEKVLTLVRFGSHSELF